MILESLAIIGAIKMALGAAAIAAIVTLVVLRYDDIVNWFRSRQRLVASDTNNIAFTLKQHLSNNNFEVVQGIFNAETNKLADGVIIRANQLDSQVEFSHRTHDLVIYR